MSSRPQSRGMRGGGQHHHQGGFGQRGYHWGPKGGNHVGGRYDYSAPPQHNHGGGRPPRPPMRHNDPEKLLASLGPDAQLALTTAIINTVLKTSDEKEPRGNFRDNREQNYRPRDVRREVRGEYYKDDRPRRSYGEPWRYESRWQNEEGRGQHFVREKGLAGGPPRPQYNRYPPKRRPSPPLHNHHHHHHHQQQAPPYKRQRMEKEQEMSSRDSHRDEDPDNDMEVTEREERDHSEERGHRKVKEDKNSESGHGGVQVTIRADGERAVNSDGHMRMVAGRLFVELKCPHCPKQKSITFKQYKRHLMSGVHKARLRRLARKHTVVLHKIRVQQRQEQRDIENKWKEEEPEEFQNAVSRFCNACKLAFKCPSSNTSKGINQHNRSKLHRMQRHYLHPRCGLCRITFPTRMEFERHVTSINHLSVRTANIENQGKRAEDGSQEEDGVDLDLANFMTLDSVGEDDEEGGGGSEHDDITGGLDGQDKDGGSGRTNGAKDRRDKEEDEEVDEDMLETEWDKEPHEDEEEEPHQPLGKEYVRRIEAYYCSICSKVIRADSSLGSRAVQRHCRTFSHISHYRDHHPNLSQDEEAISGEDGEGEIDLEEETDQDKLWEEVDKGLTALQGEIMTEIEGEEEAAEEKKEAEGEKEENENKEENEEEEEEEEATEDAKEENEEENEGEEEEEVEDGEKEVKNDEDWEEVGEDVSA